MTKAGVCMEWIWKSLLLVIAGVVLLRVAGRKSISQMSVATTVVMISIGTTIVQPIANEHLGKAIGSASIFIVSLLFLEYLQYRFNWMEELLSGKAKLVIENGQLRTDNLRSIRMTVDQLEVRLRQNGISHLSDVKNATIESNGHIGYELMPYAKPITMADIEKLMNNLNPTTQEQPQGDETLFDEVKQNGHRSAVDPKLQ